MAGSTVIGFAATFTADPVVAAVRHWLAAARVEATFRTSPFGQVFQVLLAPNGVGGTDAALNVVLARACDIPNARELATSVRDSAVRTRVTHLLVVCPSPPAKAANAAAWEQELATELAGVDAVLVLSHAEILERYPVADVFDPYGDAEASMPYTDDMFAAMGAAIARRIACALSPPKKVVVVDCDDTLWRGLCAEAGPAGVVMDAPRLALQRFLVAQRAAGMLVCICSRNEEPDVRAVFDARDDMILRAEHVTSWRVAWAPKSESIQSIAAELGLGVDSFVLVDDDPFVCAEVRERCPGVTTVCLPADPAAIPRVIENLWVFDRARVTEEDTKRADLYKQNKERETARAGMSLAAFVASLDLRVDVAPLADADVARVSQLTLRTNQFNATGVRRSEAEIRGLAAQGLECLTVSVTDRFGSYGLVGVVIYGVRDARVAVDTFLLSCRVLGRGVEHRIVAELGRIAQARGASSVTLPFEATPRNAPYAQFLASLGATERDGVHELATHEAAHLRYDPDAAPHLAVADAGSSQGRAQPARVSLPAGAPVEIDWVDVALRSSDPRARNLAVLGHRRAPVAAMPLAAAPRVEAGEGAEHGAIEAELVTIWTEVLGVDAVGPVDDFFRLGGDSLMAVRMLSRVSKRFEVELPLTMLFELDAATIREVAKHVASTRSSRME